VDAQVQTSLVSFVVNPPGPLTTTKLGGSVGFTVFLSGIALGSATLEIDSSNPYLGQPIPQTLFFPQDAWRKAQSVVVVGRDDGVTGDENYLMGFILKGTSFLVDYTQTGQSLEMVAVDDVPAILTDVTASATLANVDVMLRAPPADPVTVVLFSGAANSVEPNQLVFTPADAHTVQSVSIAYNSGISPLLSLTASSSDESYNGLAAQIQIKATR